MKKYINKTRGTFRYFNVDENGNAIFQTYTPMGARVSVVCEGMTDTPLVSPREGDVYEMEGYIKEKHFFFDSIEAKDEDTALHTSSSVMGVVEAIGTDEVTVRTTNDIRVVLYMLPNSMRGWQSHIRVGDGLIVQGHLGNKGRIVTDRYMSTADVPFEIPEEQ